MASPDVPARACYGALSITADFGRTLAQVTLGERFAVLGGIQTPNLEILACNYRLFEQPLLGKYDNRAGCHSNPDRPVL